MTLDLDEDDIVKYFDEFSGNYVWKEFEIKYKNKDEMKERGRGRKESE